MNVKILIALTCSATVWVFFVNADGELKKCPSPFVSRHIHPDNVTVFTNCRKTEPCKVYNEYMSIKLAYNLTAPCDTDIDIKKFYCNLFVTSPSKNFTSDCYAYVASGNSYIITDNAPEVNKGDKFSFLCHCPVDSQFKQNETGTYYLELLMDGEDGTDGWCASQGLLFVSKEEWEKYEIKVIEEYEDDDDDEK